MKTVRGRCAFSACVMTTFVTMLSGCTIGGKSFSIDSNSRIPFFGLELKERKPKSTAPVYQSIARTNGDVSPVTNALNVVPKTPRSRMKKDDQRITATSVPGIDTVSEQDLESRRNANDQAAQSIPLPRTDARPQSADRTATRQNFVDFQ